MINILNESIVELLKKIEALSNRVVVLEEAVLAQQFEINSLSSGMGGGSFDALNREIKTNPKYGLG